MRAVYKLLVLLVIAAVLVAGGVTLWARNIVFGPGPLAGQAILVIEQGSSLRGITDALVKSGVIREPWVFMGWVRISERHQFLKAGEYAFGPGISQEEVIEKLVSHDTLSRFLTVPEGLTSIEVLELLEANPYLSGSVSDFPADGTILPETYHYAYGADRAEIVRRMQRDMQALLAELWPRRASGLPLKSLEEAVALASIVEKETSLASERPHVAGVFVNRLRKGMRLQSDPTVAYAVTDGKAPLNRKLTRKDLKLDHPYNTYVIKGLPPGAIANPGRESLEAVLQPMETDDLYFVADGKGGHAFAKTLKQHNRNVARWRKLNRQKKANGQ